MSALSLDDVNAQIQQLEAQRAELQAAAEAHRKEIIASVVLELRAKISTYEITAKDLGLDKGKSTSRKSLGARIAGSGTTHRGPNGETWTEGNRGRKPKWLHEQIATNRASQDQAATA